MRKTQELLKLAADETRDNEFQAARDSYLHVIARIDPLPEGELRDEAQSSLALALNNLAWLQVTCPDTSLREPAEAVVRARRALAIRPNEGNYWNTLGVAYYRAGDWQQAKEALSRSIELRHDTYGFDWFFLALVELKLGNKNQARDLYAKAVNWYHQYFPQNQELYRFQVEAAQELALAKPSPPSPQSTGVPPVINNPPLRRRLHPGTNQKVTRPPRN